MKLTEENQEKLNLIDKTANAVMWWIGSVSSLIAHTIIFISAFLLPILGLIDFDKMLLVLTTILSLEAIYLAIFIQMSVNKSNANIDDLKEDIEDIQEDIEEMSEDLEEISEDIDEIQEDIEEINDDDEDDSNERAKNTMLKSNVATNKSEINLLKKELKMLQSKLEQYNK